MAVLACWRSQRRGHAPRLTRTLWACATGTGDGCTAVSAMGSVMTDTHTERPYCTDPVICSELQ